MYFYIILKHYLLSEEFVCRGSLFVCFKSTHTPVFFLLSIFCPLKKIIILVIIKDYEVRSMISIPGSLSFVMSSAPAKKSAGDARCASQDPLTHDKSHKISTLENPHLKECVLPTWNANTMKTPGSKIILNCRVVHLVSIRN